MIWSVKVSLLGHSAGRKTEDGSGGPERVLVLLLQGINPRVSPQQTHQVPSPIHHSKALSVSHTSNKNRVRDPHCPAQKVTGNKEDQENPLDAGHRT